ncbi:MAG: ATP-binding protein [Candidatus Margulisbacteria bacterium]|nr:ATP-binding protein [Candidatus Margulisiibacteriota bacterium]
MIKRLQTPILKKWLKKFALVVIIGARQVGKTTLVRKLLKTSRKYFTFDDAATVLSAASSPEAFLLQAPQVTVDEAQKVADIFPSIKKLIDEKRVPGQFVITGSANLPLLPKINESLAGRAAYVEMYPLTIWESLQRTAALPKLVKLVKQTSGRRAWNFLLKEKPTTIPLPKLICRGGLPNAWLENDDAARQAWFKSYVTTYLEKDIRDLSQIKNLHEFRKFLALSAFRSGQILSKSDLARDAGISYTTACHFFNLLLATFQIFTVEPYFQNIGKRLTKAPKLMWNDTGLAIHLQGLTSFADLERLGRTGHLLENRIAIELKTLLEIYLPSAKLFYWRTSAGAEIDFVIEHKSQLIPIEVKWAEKINRHEIKSLENFLQDFPATAPWGVVLYRGRSLLKVKENLFLIPLELVL